MRSKFQTAILGFFLVLFPVLFQVMCVDNPSFRWAHFRWYLFLSIFFLIITNYIKFNKWMIANFLAIYGIVTTSNALIFKLVKGIALDGEFCWDDMSFAMGIISVVYTLIVLLRQSKLKFTGVLAFIELAAISPYIMNITYAVMEKDIIDVNSLIAVYQTNSKEIVEFLLSSAPVYTYFGLTLFLLAIYGYFYSTLAKIEVGEITYKIKQCIALCIAIIGIVAITNKVVHYSYFVRIYSDSKQYLQAVQRYSAYRVDENGKLKNIPAKANSGLDNETFLVVIGESQNRQHMSVYGYERKTTPWLDEMSADDNFVLMDNGYACHTLTMMALSQVLTEKSQYNKKPLEQSYSLIDIARAAGYKTYWISNQAQFGSFNTPVTTIVNMADEKIWLNSDSSAGVELDEKVLDAIKTIPNSGKKIVFIHLFGNHWTYKHRYPADRFNVFQGKEYVHKAKDVQVVNEYDNSMVYNDYIMEHIFNYAKKNWDVANIAYVSDHSEAVKSGNKHIPGKYERDMATIPVYFYFSDEYISHNKEKFDRIIASKKIPFTNDMMYNMLLDIWGIDTPYYNAKENCFSGEYGYPEKALRILDEIKI